MRFLTVTEKNPRPKWRGFLFQAGILHVGSNNIDNAMLS